MTLNCPKCNEEISTDVVEEVKNESRFSFVIYPNNLESLKTLSVAEILKNVDKMATAGTPYQTLIERVSNSDDSGLRFDFIVCRKPNAKKQATVEKA